MIRLPTLPFMWPRIAKGASPEPEQLERLCRGDIYRYALRRTGHVEDAEDIAADTFAAALDVLHTFRGDTEPRLWLLGIARRKIVDRARCRIRQPEHSLVAADELPDLGRGPESTLLSVEAAETIRAMIQALPEDQREALLLQVADGLSVCEVATVMGRSASSVNSLLGRARATLRARGAAYFGESHE